MKMIFNSHCQNLNSLPQDVVVASSLNILKNRNDEQWCKRDFLYYYNSDAFEDIRLDIPESCHLGKH